MSRPLVSVIVPAWGVADLVGDALRSLVTQTVADWEAIVVDDGGADVAAAVAPFAAGDPRIRFLATPHGGVSAARNHAIAAARAPLIAFLDGDDAWLPGYLAAMLPAIGVDPGLGFVTCDATFFGGTRRDGRRFSHFLPQRGDVTLGAVIARTFNVFIGSIARVEAIRVAGGFDTTLAQGEDLDLWIRILETGRRAGHVAQPLVRYRRRANSATTSTRALRLATARVFEQAEARLAGRPEAAIARRMAARMRDEAGWSEGEELIAGGRVREGLAVLRRSRAGRQSPRWRAMMALFAVAPPLARPVLDLRRRRFAGEP